MYVEYLGQRYWVENLHCADTNGNCWLVFNASNYQTTTGYLRRKLRDKAKKAMNYKVSDIQYNSLVPLIYGEVPPTKSVPKRKEHNMYNELNVIETSDSQKQRKYLQSRLSSVYGEKIEGFRKQFWLDVDYPKNPADMLARLQAGKFTVKGADEKKQPDWDWSGAWMAALSWRTQEEDCAGYDAAFKKLEALYQSTTDTIMIKDPAEGLTALQAFESATIN